LLRNPVQVIIGTKLTDVPYAGSWWELDPEEEIFA